MTSGDETETDVDDADNFSCKLHSFGNQFGNQFGNHFVLPCLH